MPLQHVVKRGDSLWGLAGRHLGNFARWPELVDYHNDEVRKSAGNRARVFPIKDPNLIFVGQILYLPIRDKHMIRTANATGTKAKAGNMAVPTDLKVEYSFGLSGGGGPVVYDHQADDYFISVAMRGKITIEITSPDRFRHNLELVTSKDELQCKQKLKEIYNPAIAALTAKPEMAFQMDTSKMAFKQGIVTIDSPIMTEGAIGAYRVQVASGEQDHLTGSANSHLSGSIEITGREFKYKADIELKVAVQTKIVDLDGAHGKTSEILFKDATYGFRAAGVVIRETAKIVLVDVAFALTNYIPLPPNVSFWSGRVLSGGVTINNYRGLGQTALKIEIELEDIRKSVYSK